MKIRTLILSLTLTLGFLVEAQRSPQDSWFLDRKIPFSQMPGLNVPYGITFSEDGNLHVVDHGSDRITVWDTSGKFLKAWGRSGSADGQLNNPIDLAIGGGEIFVVEQSNHRVQVFDMDGNFIRKFYPDSQSLSSIGTKPKIAETFRKNFHLPKFTIWRTNYFHIHPLKSESSFNKKTLSKRTIRCNPSKQR